MGMHEDRIKALRFEFPEQIPISAGILPAAWIKYREELDEIVASHPILFGGHKMGDRDYDAVGGTYFDLENPRDLRAFVGREYVDFSVNLQCLLKMLLGLGEVIEFCTSAAKLQECLCLLA